MSTVPQLPHVVQVILGGTTITFTPVCDGVSEFWNASHNGRLEQLPWRVSGAEQTAFFRSLAGELAGRGLGQ